MITEEFKEAMQMAGFSIEDIRKAIHCFDTVLINYNVSKKEANIAIYDSLNINNRYLDLYIQCRKFEGLAEVTLRNQRYYLIKYINNLTCSVLDATTMHVRLFLSQFSDDGYCNDSVEKIKSYVSAFYNWLIRERQASYNPCSAIPKIKTAFRYQGYLSGEELKYIKFACKDLRESLLIEFLLSTGCRIDEFVNIKLSSINMNDKSVVVRGKGNKEREIYFSSEAKVLIKKLYGDKFDKERYLYGSKRNGKCNGNKLTTAQTRNNLEEIVDRVKDHIKLAKVTPHTFRRTFATTLLAKGVALEIVSKLLGHSALQTTLRYVFISDSTLQTEHHKFVA